MVDNINLLMAGIDEILRLSPVAENAPRGASLAQTILPGLMLLKEAATDPGEKRYLCVVLDRCGEFLLLAARPSIDVNLGAAATQAYGIALQLCNRRDDPLFWATMQFNRASTFVWLGQEFGDHERKIAAFRVALQGFDAALQVFTRTSVPDRWAGTQSNRALALMEVADLLEGEERLEAIRIAVRGFDSALEVATTSTFPEIWATSILNRANALESIARASREEESLVSLQGIADSCDVALAAGPSVLRDGLWSKLLAMRTSALSSLAEMLRGRERISAYDRAIQGCDEALGAIDEVSMPATWVLIHQLRAQTLERYATHLSLPMSVLALRAAIQSHEAAEKVATPVRTPVRWASSQINRAMTLTQLGQQIGGHEGERALLQAIFVLEEALGIFSSQGITDTLTRGRVETVRARALLLLDPTEEIKSKLASTFETIQDVVAFYGEHKNAGAEIQAARVLFSAAIVLDRWDAVHNLALQMVQTFPTFVMEGKTLNHQLRNLHLLDGIGDLVAYGLAKVGHFEQSICTADYGRDQLTRAPFGFEEADLPAVRRQAIEEARRLLAEKRDHYAEKSKTQNIAATEAAYRSLTEAHSSFINELKISGLADSSNLTVNWRSLLTGSTRAIVMFCVTHLGALVIVAQRGVETLSSQHCLFLPRLTQGRLNQLFRNQERTGWLDAYSAYMSDLRETNNGGSAAGLFAWNKSVFEMLGCLWKEIMEPVDEKLRSLGVEPTSEVLLIPSGRLNLLPLHAAGTRVNGRWRCFLDSWAPAYVPSVASIIKRGTVSSEPLSNARLLAVTGPSADLAGMENPAIKYFDKVEELVGGAATSRSVLDALPRCDYACLLCHGEWDPSHPQDSALILGDGERLTFAQLAKLELTRNPLIALAACETALADIGTAPNEYQGLSFGLLRAGARGTAATYWPVFAHVADHTLSEMFDQLRNQGAPPSAALRSSIISLRDSGKSTPDGLQKIEAFLPEVTDSSIPLLKINPSGHELVGIPARETLLSDLSNPMHWAVYALIGR
jgi:CHAT domain-containing protein